MVAETQHDEVETVEAETVEEANPSKAVAQYDERRAATVPANQEATLLGVIERVACNPDVDIERMQALLSMRADEEERQRRIAREDREEEARREYLTAFARVQAEIGPIFRSRENKHTRSTYATLEDIERVATPILSKHGFSTTTVPVHCDLPGHIRVRLTIGHAGGHERHYEDDFPLDAAGAQGNTNKTGIQAKGSTKTYARRYLKADALDLSFTDDRDGNRPQQRDEDLEPLSEDRVKHIRAELESLGADEAAFCQHIGVPNLMEMPAGRFGDACEALATKRRIVERKKAEAAKAASAPELPGDRE